MAERAAGVDRELLDCGEQRNLTRPRLVAEQETSPLPINCPFGGGISSTGFHFLRLGFRVLGTLSSSQGHTFPEGGARQFLPILKFKQVAISLPWSLSACSLCRGAQGYIYRERKLRTLPFG